MIDPVVRRRSNGRRVVATLSLVQQVLACVLPLVFVLTLFTGLYSYTSLNRLAIRTTTTGTMKKATPSQSSSSSLHPLRFDYTDLDVYSPLANLFASSQENCSRPQALFLHRNQAGLGSDLHMYSKALCNAVEGGLRIASGLPWIWNDVETCASRSNNGSSMTCYFPSSELKCPRDEFELSDPRARGQMRTVPGIKLKFNNSVRRYIIPRKCLKIQKKYGVGIPEVRAATIEFLFTRLSPSVVEEAVRQFHIVFGGRGTGSLNGTVAAAAPPNLITVHVRWGDKKADMDLLPVEKYTRAVEDILRQRSLQRNATGQAENDDVNIYLATEDPRAAIEFVKAAPSHWNVYVDEYVQKFGAVRNSRFGGNAFNANPTMSRGLNGNPGLVSLGSLLIALEANDFILTTRSNWSRVMNELRKSILDPRCNKCTQMIDLTTPPNFDNRL